jgi:hypothetical protein
MSFGAQRMGDRIASGKMQIKRSGRIADNLGELAHGQRVESVTHDYGARGIENMASEQRLIGQMLFLADHPRIFREMTAKSI